MLWGGNSVDGGSGSGESLAPKLEKSGPFADNSTHPSNTKPRSPSVLSLFGRIYAVPGQLLSKIFCTKDNFLVAKHPRVESKL